MAEAVKTIPADVLAALKSQNPLIRPEDITPEMLLDDDLGLDSLDQLEMELALEDARDIEIPDGELDGVRTVGDFVARIDAVTARKIRS